MDWSSSGDTPVLVALSGARRDVAKIRRKIGDIDMVMERIESERRRFYFSKR